MEKDASIGRYMVHIGEPNTGLDPVGGYTFGFSTEGIVGSGLYIPEYGFDTLGIIRLMI